MQLSSGQSALRSHSLWAAFFVGAAVGTLGGIAAGLGIGIIASLLGVAGGEFLIPTMLVGFARYSRDRSFSVLAHHKTFALWMALGSIAGAFLGSQLLRVASGGILLPILALVLVVSAIKLWRHR